MDYKENKEQRERFQKSIFLLDYEIVQDQLLKNEEYKRLYDINSSLYDKCKLISTMSDGTGSISQEEVDDKDLIDLITYHQNLLIMNDYLMIQFYKLGKKDLYLDLKKIELL